jgi:lysophospholipase L1-like esterase
LDNKGRRVLFQGDSITDAGRSREGEPPNRALGNGYVTLISSRLGYQFAEANHQFYNRGLGGNRVSDLYARWNEDAISLQPDIISILIGVNDAWRIMNKMPEGVTDRFKRVYRHLLEETKEVLPNADLVLCEPFILPVGALKENWEEWRRRLDVYGQTVRLLAEEFDAVFVSLQVPFDQAAQRCDASYWSSDGVHATAAGHELIATEWLSAVQISRLALTN